MSFSKPVDDPKRALNSARRLLMRRARSVQEMRLALKVRGFTPAAIDAAVAHCRGTGELDDAACARLLATHWTDSGYGWSVVRARLGQRGIPAALIESLEAQERMRQEDACRRLLERKRALDAPRLRRLLLRRGFALEIVESVLKQDGECNEEQ